MASEATLMDVIGNKYIDTKTIEIIQHHFLIHHCPCLMQVYRAIALLFKLRLKPKIFYLIRPLDPKEESDPTEYPDCLLKNYVFNLSKLHILSHFPIVPIATRSKSHQ